MLEELTCRHFHYLPSKRKYCVMCFTVYVSSMASVCYLPVTQGAGAAAVPDEAQAGSGAGWRRGWRRLRARHFSPYMPCAVTRPGPRNGAELACRRAGLAGACKHGQRRVRLAGCVRGSTLELCAPQMLRRPVLADVTRTVAPTVEGSARHVASVALWPGAFLELIDCVDMDFRSLLLCNVR